MKMCKETTQIGPNSPARALISTNYWTNCAPKAKSYGLATRYSFTPYFPNKFFSQKQTLVISVLQLM